MGKLPGKHQDHAFLLTSVSSIQRVGPGGYVHADGYHRRSVVALIQDLSGLKLLGGQPDGDVSFARGPGHVSVEAEEVAEVCRLVLRPKEE